MWPMLLGVGPLLGSVEVGGFRDAEGGLGTWSYNEGRAELRGPTGKVEVTMQLASDPFVFKSLQPVAILIDQRTASSGEGLAIAFCGRGQTRFFGRHTAGLSTANHGYELGDGAHLVLTVAVDLDRTGRAYEDGIQPDVDVAAGSPGEIDPVTQAAVEWIAGLHQ
jgi:carboxyl-terminal processing protease